jgi:hypothetical protein
MALQAVSPSPGDTKVNGKSSAVKRIVLDEICFIREKDAGITAIAACGCSYDWVREHNWKMSCSESAPLIFLNRLSSFNLKERIRLQPGRELRLCAWPVESRFHALEF